MRVLCLLWDFPSKHFHLFLSCLHAMLEHNWELDLHTIINIINLIAIWAPPQVLQNRLCWTMLENYLFIFARAWSCITRCQRKQFQRAQIRLQTSLQYGGLLWVSSLFSSGFLLSFPQKKPQTKQLAISEAEDVSCCASFHKSFFPPAPKMQNIYSGGRQMTSPVTYVCNKYS